MKCSVSLTEISNTKNRIHNVHTLCRYTTFQSTQGSYAFLKNAETPPLRFKS